MIFLINIIHCDDGEQSNEGPLKSAERRHVDCVMTMNSPSLTLDQAKQRAYAIKARMTELGNSVSMTHAYELVATSCGYRNWPTMKASLVDTEPSGSNPAPSSAAPANSDLKRLIADVREMAHDIDRGSRSFCDDFPGFQQRVSKLAQSSASLENAFDRFWTAAYGGARAETVPGHKSGTPFLADKLLKDAGDALLQIFQICNGDYSDYDGVEWSHEEDEKRYGKLTSYAIRLKAILQRLEMPVFQPRRWHHVRTSPPAGGTYVIGGYVQHASMPRHFEWAFASFRMTVDGPEWSHKDERHKHVPIEYWTELGAHPEHAKPDPRGMIFIDKDELLGICVDLEEVRKAAFGDVGDSPDIYGDYDELSRLAGVMRKALRKLDRRRFEPGATV
jgi:hypothetical protein